MALKEVQAWKTTFYKNASSEGGAMKHAIKNLPEDNIVIHSQTVKNGRMWGYTTPTKLLTLIEKNKGLYEVITKFPHKLYFDIDGDGNNNEGLPVIKSIIEDFFPKADMAISGSITPAKTSYHIIINNYVIHNEAERCYVKTIVKHIHDTINKDFDPVIYNKNRNMKCINQSKPDGRIQAIIENEDYKRHLITCFLPEYSLPFPELEGEMEEVVMVQKAKETFDLGTLPKIKRTRSKAKDFDITTATPLDILAILPINKNFTHDYTHLVARFCFYNSIEIKSFLAWLQPKHAEGSPSWIQRWEHNWTRLDKFPSVSARRIEAILNYYYPHILKNKPYKRFLNTFVADPEIICKIDTIEPSHFDVENKFILFNTGMGSGKTTQTINYLKNAGNKFLWLCPNKALAHNTLYRLEKEDVDTKYYLNYNAKQKNNGILNDVGSLIVVLNSLHYLGVDPKASTTDEDEYIPCRPFSIIVIDEIETLLDKFLGDFMKNKKEVWTQFLKLLRNADKVILLDAFITSKTLDFINAAVGEMSPAPLMYERISEPTTRTVNYIKNDATMINDIITKLKDNKKCFIYYPYKYESGSYAGMEKLSNMLKLATGKDGVFYNADVDDAVKATLKDVNKAWKPYDYVITNNIITCGVNYDTLNDFDESYIFIASFSCPRDIIQVSYRVRDLVNKKINVCYLGRMNQPNTFISDTHHIGCKIYSSLIDAVLVEKYSPLKATFQLFCDKAHYDQVVDKHIISSELGKYVAELKDTADCGFSYKNIPDIDNKFAQRIEQKMFSQDASMLEKMMLKKYYFLLEWNVDSIAIKTENDDDVGQIETYWNKNCLTFFQQLKRIIFEENSLFNNIKKYNNFAEFFPTTEEIKKVKLNDVLLDEIFKEFKFKFISRITNPKKILQEIYNVYFKKYIITTVADGHNTTYELTTDYDVHSYYDFALENLKQPLKNVLAEKLMPEDEAVCDFNL